MKKLSLKDRFQLELFTNLEPCLMCLGTAISSFVGKVFFAVEAPDDGAVEFVSKEFELRKLSSSNPWHFPEVEGGLLREQSIQLFREYVESGEDKRGMVFVRSIAELK